MRWSTAGDASLLDATLIHIGDLLGDVEECRATSILTETGPGGMFCIARAPPLAPDSADHLVPGHVFPRAKPNGRSDCVFVCTLGLC